MGEVPLEPAEYEFNSQQKQLIKELAGLVVAVYQH